MSIKLSVDIISRFISLYGLIFYNLIYYHYEYNCVFITFLYLYDKDCFYHIFLREITKLRRD